MSAMAPKRAAKLPEPSASSSEATSASVYSSSDDEEAETRRPSSPPKQKPTIKSSTTPISPIPQATRPTVKPSQNRPPAPAASSDGGDDEDDTDREENSGEDGSSSEESDTEDARTNKQVPPPPPPVRAPAKPDPQPPVLKPTPPKPSSDSGSSEGSDSGSDSSEEDATPAAVPRPSRATDPSIKPINTKPMDGPTRSGKPAASPASTPGQDSHRRKGDSVDSCQKDNIGGRQFFQRLWSLDDEITLLDGVVEYHRENGCFPSRASIDAFRDRIKGSLQMEVTSTQLVNKLRTLKKKFQTNAARYKNGTGPTFTKRQEQVTFELSKKLWGSNKVGTEDIGASPVNEDNELCERETKVNRKRKDGNLKPVDVSDPSNASNKKFKGTETGNSQYPLLWETVTKMADEKLCGVAIKRAMDMLDNVRANLMEEKLKKLRITQIKQHLRRADLHTKTLKLISDAITRSV